MVYYYVPGDSDLTVSPDILEVLVTEDQDLALRSVQSEFVKTLLGKLRELNATDFSAKVWTDMADFGVLVEEVGLGWVSPEASIGVLCRDVSINLKLRMA